MSINKKLDLGKESIYKLFFSFSIPAILAMVGTVMASLVDSYFIGNYIGSEGVAGITLVMPLLNVFIGVAAMITSGGVVLAGIAYGEKNIEKSNHYFNLTFSLSVLAGIFLMLLIFVFADYLVLDVLNIKGELAIYVQDYLKTLVWFLIPYLLVFFFEFFLKLDGMPFIIVLGISFGVMVNVILDFLFIREFQWGMRGVALATGISQVVPVLIFLWFTLKKSSFSFQWPRFLLKDIKMIFFNGSSEFLDLSSLGIAGYFYNLFIVKYHGEEALASFGIAMQVSGIAIMIFYGISDAIHSIVSYNYGAKLYKRIDHIRYLAFTVSVVFGAVIFIVLWFYGEAISGLFVQEQEVIALSGHIMSFFAAAMLILGLNLNTSIYYTALGRPVKSSLIALSRSLIFPLIGLILLPLVFKENGLWMTLFFAESMTLIITLSFLKYFPYGALRKKGITS